jgi:hypothetical protein
MAQLRDRSTADLVVIFLAACVGAIMVASVIGFIMLEIFAPEKANDTLALRITTLTSNLIGVIAGYLAGRASNGKPIDKGE